jgi:hypothetical protein
MERVMADCRSFESDSKCQPDSAYVPGERTPEPFPA